MKAVFYNRDYSAKIPIEAKVEVERYSWNMLGGPASAILTIDLTADKWELLKILRCPVEIYSRDGKKVWWGFVNRVSIPHEVQRFGLSLNELYNHVTISYNGGDTEAGSDTNSISEYGQKEARITDNNATAFQGVQTRDVYLEEHRYPRPEIDFSGEEGKIQVECYGWYRSFAWKHYSNTSTTNIENTTQITAIASSAGQFLEGTIIEDTAGVVSNPYRDGSGNGLTLINDLLHAGTSNTRPLLANVDDDRYLHVYERVAEPPTTDPGFLLREDGRLETLTGILEPGENCTAGVWVRVKDAVGMGGLSEMRSFFIESAEYDVANDTVSYKPAGAFEQVRMAKYITDVVSGNSSGNSNWGKIWPGLIGDPDDTYAFWSALGLSTDSITNVRCFALYGTTLYVGGTFTEIGGITATNIASLDLATGVWSALGAGLASDVNALGHDGTFLYAGAPVGDDYIQKWNGTTWAAVGGGLAGGNVGVIHVDGTDVYIGGTFTSAGGDGNCAGICLWNGAAYVSLGAGITIGNSVAAIYVDGSTLYAAGDFTEMDSVAASYAAEWDGADWTALGSGLSGNPGRYNVDIAKFNSEIIFTGEFALAGGVANTLNIAAWTGSAWEPLGIGINDIGWVLGVDTTNNWLYAVGEQTTAGGVTTYRASRWDGANWYSINIGDSGSYVYSAIMYGSNLIVGGDFTTVDADEEKTANKIAIYISSLDDLLSYLDGGGSASRSPGGPDSAIQFNNSGEFGGEPEFAWDKVNNNLQMGNHTVPVAGSVTFHQIQEGTSPAHFLWAYGAAKTGFIVGLHANGTVASPTAAVDNDSLLKLRGRGYHSGGSWSNSMATIQLVADENFTAANQGTRIEFWTTPLTTTTPVLGMTVNQDGGIYVNNSSRVKKDQDAVTSLTVANEIAGGNTSASAQLAVKSSTSSGFLGAFPDDFATAAVQDFIGLGADSNAAGFILRATTGGQVIQFSAGQNNVNYHMDITGFGLNTTSPNERLEVSNTTNVGIRLASTAANITAGQNVGRIDFYSADASGAGVGVRASVRAYAVSQWGLFGLAFATGDAAGNNVDRVFILSGGGIFIEGGTDTVQLTVQGNAPQTSNLVVFRDSTTANLVVVSGTGSVGIGPTAPGDSALHVSKTISGASHVYAMNFIPIALTSATQHIYGIFESPTTVTLTTASKWYVGAYLGHANTLVCTTGNWAGVWIDQPTTLTGSLTNAYGLYIGNISHATNDYAIHTQAGTIWFNSGGDASTDVIMSGDTEPNLFRMDAGVEEVRLGDWDTNYFTTDKAGDTWWVGGGGLLFGEIHVTGIDEDIVLAAEDTYYQVDSWSASGAGVDGESNGTTPDESNDHITALVAGMYMVHWHVSCYSAQKNEYEFEIFVNNGAAGFEGTEAYRTTSTAGAIGLASGGGICDLAANDTVELWVERKDGAAVAKTLTIRQATISITQIGGT